MKALTYTLSLLLSVTLISGCSNNQYAQQEYDDMYFTAQDREKEIAAEQARLEARRQAQLEQQQEAAAAERTKNAYDQYDAQSARELNPDAATAYGTESEEQYYEEEYYTEEQATTSGSGTAVYNNHYYNNRPAYDPWMYDPYGYSASPWGRNSYWGRPGFGSGVSISFGMGWNSWGSFCDPFWDPWCGSSAYYYNAYRPAWAWNGWGYQNPYAHGYRNGFYDGYYGRRNYWGAYYPSTVVVVNSDNNPRRNVTYGPRSSRAMAVADMGVGTRAGNNQGLREERRQRIESDEVRSRGTINGRQQRNVRPATDGVRGRSVPTDNRGNNRTTTPTTRPQRTPRTEPSRSNEARPQRQPVERSRPAQTRPSTPQTRPSSPTRGNGGGAAPSRSRGGRGGEPMSIMQDNNLNEGRAQRPSSSDNARPQVVASPAQTREQAAPAERRSEAVVERNSYTRPQRPERRVEDRQYSTPAPERASRNSRRSSIQDRNYSTPAPTQRNTDYNRSYSAPERSASPSRTYSSPAQSSRPAPSMSNGGGSSRSSSGSSTPSRSSSEGSSSRSRRGN
jgi:outer membrane murein-binding lipoprotein Lpp